MALIIEDGTVVTGAESFATVAQARSYATKRGVTLSATDSVVEQQLIKACDYLQSREAEMQGVRTSPALQELCFPRSGVWLHSEEISPNAIPAALINAQCALVVHVANNVNLMPVSAGRVIKKEKLDVIETEYETSGGAPAMPAPVLRDVDGILAPLLQADGGGGGFSIIRV